MENDQFATVPPISHATATNVTPTILNCAVPVAFVKVAPVRLALVRFMPIPSHHPASLGVATAMSCGFACRFPIRKSHTM